GRRAGLRAAAAVRASVRLSPGGPVRPRGRRSQVRALPPVRGSACGGFVPRSHASRTCTMTTVGNLGFPRIGAKRELKRALEAHWRGESTAQQLHATARDLRVRHWRLQCAAGADAVPCNDFSLYDHVLDTAFGFDAIPQRYRALADAEPLAGYFAMARGRQQDGTDLPALEMTKWFDTNSHYRVPELHAGQRFALRGDKPVAEFLEAKALGLNARPVLLGPVSFLLLSKTVDGSDRLALLDALLPAYAELLDRLRAAGAQWVQVDEPCLVLDLDDDDRGAFRRAYAALAGADRPKLLLATYFGALGDNAALTASLPVDGLHVDLVRAPGQLDAVLDALPPGRLLSLGLVDGRNGWRTDLDRALALAQRARDRVGGDRLQLAPSCSLLHAPIDATLETALPADLHGWLAFARQKIEELRTLADALNGLPSAASTLEVARERLAARGASPRVHRPAVAARVASLEAGAGRRTSAYPARRT